MLRRVNGVFQAEKKFYEKSQKKIFRVKSAFSFVRLTDQHLIIQLID